MAPVPLCDKRKIKSIPSSESLVATVTPRFLVDENQRPTDVVLTIDQWHQIQDDLDQLDDIRAYDAAKASPQDAVPLRSAIQEIRESRSS